MKTLAVLLMLLVLEAAPAQLPKQPVKQPAKVLAKARVIKDAPMISLPATVQGEIGQPIPVPATTNGRNVTWIVMDKGLYLFPVELLKDTRTAVASGGTKGKFRLMALTAIADEISQPAFCIVVIGSIPDPVVPIDPVVPDPIDPADPLLVAIKTAYAADKDPNKADAKAKLAKVYRTAAKETVDDPNITTWEQLLTIVATDGKDNVGDPNIVLNGTRKTIAAHFKTVFPTRPPRPLVDPGRQLAADNFNKVALILEIIK